MFTEEGIASAEITVVSPESTFTKVRVLVHVGADCVYENKCYSATSLKSKTFDFFDTLTYFVKYLLNHTSQGGQIRYKCSSTIAYSIHMHEAY